MVGDGSANNPTAFIEPRLDVSVILEQLMEVWWQTLQSKGGYASYDIEDRAAVRHSHTQPDNKRQMFGCSKHVGFRSYYIIPEFWLFIFCLSYEYDSRGIE